MKNIGNSLLPSSDPRILAPIKCKAGQLQVVPCEDADTYALVLTTDQYTATLATHPNGYSCHALAERLLAGDRKRTDEQIKYIIACRGTAQDPERIAELMHTAKGAP